MSGYKDTNISTHFKTFLNCRITHLDVLSSKSFLCTWGSKNSSPLVTRHSSGFRDKNESDKGGVLPCWTCEAHFIRYLLTKEVTTNLYLRLQYKNPWRLYITTVNDYSPKWRWTNESARKALFTCVVYTKTGCYSAFTETAALYYQSLSAKTNDGAIGTLPT